MSPARFITIALLGFSFALQAQDTIYISKQNKWLKNAEGAESYLVVTRENELSKVSEYSLDGVLNSIAYYSTFNKERSKCKREGDFTLFYKNGNIASICHYKNNKRDGEYRKFYWSGKKKLLCSYVDGKHDGKLMMYYPNDTVWRDEVYKDGKLQQGHVYNEKGQEQQYEPLEALPQFPGGQNLLLAYLKTNLKYPTTAAKLKQEGRVIVRFVVDKDGKIMNPEVIRSVNLELDNAALDLIKKMAREVTWIPGMQDGERIKVRFTAPINFKLKK